MAKIIQIIPAIDWYYKHETTVWNIAAFGLNEEGQTIGLIGALTDGTLKHVPTVPGGIYLHRRQLTAQEMEAADNKR